MRHLDLSRPIYTVDRPYVLTFHLTGVSFVLSSAEAQRLLNPAAAILLATSHRIVFDATPDRHCEDGATLQPATHGSDPAFIQ